MRVRVRVEVGARLGLGFRVRVSFNFRCRVREGAHKGISKPSVSMVDAALGGDIAVEWDGRSYYGPRR